ncbi:hypothetical protein [Alcanivorax sp. 24]|nr:hypothetical protein [Alcanivorax sp. 24]
MMIKKNGKHTIRWAAARYEAIVLSRTPKEENLNLRPCKRSK